MGSPKIMKTSAEISNEVKILLATPIYPPEIGGPAQYVKNLAERLKKEGIETQIVSYNNLRKIPQPFRFLVYFLKLLGKARDYQVIYVFNLIGCGLSGLVCSKVFRKKFIIRLGGDFLWERAVESGRSEKPLKEYYEQQKTIKERFWMFLMKKVLNGADRIIFTSNFQRGIYERHFKIAREKTTIISNPFPRLNFKETWAGKPVSRYQVLYAGRLIKLKNLDALIEIFSKIIKKTNLPLTLKIVGRGPERKNLECKIKDLELKDKVFIEKSLPHGELLREIQKSYFCILLSLSEISPNFALECIKLGKPILLTRETGIFEDFKNHLIFINPKDRQDIEEKLMLLLDKDNYREYAEKIKKIPVSYSWRQVTEKHTLLLKRIL